MVFNPLKFLRLRCFQGRLSQILPNDSNEATELDMMLMNCPRSHEVYILQFPRVEWAVLGHI